MNVDTPVILIMNLSTVVFLSLLASARAFNRGDFVKELYEYPGDICIVKGCVGSAPKIATLLCTSLKNLNRCLSYKIDAQDVFQTKVLTKQN